MRGEVILKELDESGPTSGRMGHIRNKMGEWTRGWARLTILNEEGVGLSTSITLTQAERINGNNARESNYSGPGVFERWLLFQKVRLEEK